MLKNYLIIYLTSCENLNLIKVGVLNPDLAMLFIPLCSPLHRNLCILMAQQRAGGFFPPLAAPVFPSLPYFPHKLEMETVIRLSIDRPN